MSKSVVICEKGSQKKNIVEAVGSQYGDVFFTQGHVMTLEEPEDVSEAWKAWDHYEVMIPSSGRFGLKVSNGQGAFARFSQIENALKSADCVIIATDCDREGQLLGQEVIEHCGFKGEVRRAMFDNEDVKTLQEAFANAKDNRHYQSVYDAGMARCQSDQVYNLSLTRAVSTAFGGFGQPIGIGRVKTPTLAIACMRELEIVNFKPKDYFEIKATCAVASGAFDVRYAPDEENRIVQRDEADQIRAKAEGWTGPLSVKTERKSRKPYALYDLPGLQKACAAKFGWSAKKTLDTFQALYDEHKLTSYPRSEVKHLKEVMIAEVPSMIKALLALGQFSNVSINEPVIRTGKAGFFCDKTLAAAGASHTAVVPNYKTADEFAAKYAQLSPDEKLGFDLVAGRYLAAMMPDYVYDQTTAIADVHGFAFKATGQVVVHPGWRAVPGEQAKEDAVELPKISDGERGALAKAVVEAKQTKPPTRFNEGSLIDAMQNAWKYVPEGPEQDRLKEAKGIGTPATRDSIIESLKHQGLLTIAGTGKSQNIVPTAKGLELYQLLEKMVPILVDPGETARWELHLDEIVNGSLNADRVIQDIAKATAGFIETIKAKAGTVKLSGADKKPTLLMLKAVTGVSSRLGIAVPPDVRKSFDACKTFLDQHMTDDPYPPSDAQAALVERIQTSLGILAPVGWREDSKLAGKFIDDNLKKATLPPSARQIEVIKGQIERGKTPPEGWETNGKIASKFLDECFKGFKKKPAGGKGKKPYKKRSVKKYKKS